MGSPNLPKPALFAEECSGLQGVLTKNLSKRSIRAQDDGLGQPVRGIDFDLDGQRVDADQGVGGEFGEHE